MPVEMGMWRIDGDTPKRLVAATLPSEATLEQYLERDPSLLGERLLVIGRQVHTPHGKFIDLLAMDGEGNLHVLELKRDKTPRDVVAQVLDYARG
jgi:RecB family endonuclease NucS